MKSKGYTVSYDSTDYETHKELYLTTFMKLINSYKKGNYLLSREEDKILIIKNKTNDNVINSH